jgi:hypothetical protein
VVGGAPGIPAVHDRRPIPDWVRGVEGRLGCVGSGGCWEVLGSGSETAYPPTAYPKHDIRGLLTLFHDVAEPPLPVDVIKVPPGRRWWWCAGGGGPCACSLGPGLS